MHRRQFLGLAVAAGTAALAGCGGDDLSDWLFVERATPERIAAVRTRQVTDQTRREFLSRIVTNGTLTLTDEQLANDPAIPDTYYVTEEITQFDGSVYSVTSERARTVTYRDQSVDLDINESDGAADAPGVVEYGDLPAVDRRALASAFGNASSEASGSGVETSPFRARYPASQINESRLAGSTTNVTGIGYNGTRYDLDIEPLDESEVEFVEFRVVEQWTLAEFADRVREQFLFPLDGLSEAERTVVDEAITAGEYQIDGDDGAESLHEKLDEHERLGGGGPGGENLRTPPYTGPYRTGVWLVAYEGSDYLFQYTEKTYD